MEGYADDEAVATALADRYGVFSPLRKLDQWLFPRPPKGGADLGPPLIPSGPQVSAGLPWANKAAAVGSQLAYDMTVPSTPSDYAMMAAGPLGKLSKLAKLGLLAGGYALDPSEAEAGKVSALKKAAQGFTQLASPEEINRVARETEKGVTQPRLREVYDELGLTGREPSDLVKPSLAAQQPQEAIDQAIALKNADRALMNEVLTTPDARKEFAKTGKLPGGQMLPSQEIAQPGLDAYAPLKKEVTKAEKAFDKQGASGSLPNTVLFDLSPQTLNKVPDVPQFQLPRVAPGMSDRLATAQRGGLARLENAAGKAPQENWGWYNLMQARDVFHGLHGQQKGEQAFQAWLDAVAGTSMVNPIDNNLRSSTWYLQQLLQGKPLPDVRNILDQTTGKSVRLMTGGPPPGYGAKSQIQHADRVQEYLTHSYDPVSNPKPISYRTNLSGNWVPRTVDTHDIRNAIGMPHALDLFGENAGLLPKEYSYLEQLGARAAKRAGSTNAAQQAATWVGGGDYTGLKSYPAPLLSALNRRAHVTAQVRGTSPWDALLDAFRGTEPLL
ncbi:hypothetical protein JQ581_29990 [Bradyrhizobium liaoningense]|uniref:hypothetical protein n=1 Tax=Bradyrhizobium liaoningense TaxID=43992 RepID=UPI001BA5C4C8|nr:hypothetical protein [Bradyrhizobium liaoningense]MBR0741171.1 hypothetical protein [Bradyrhizobium liaoningense]